MFANLLLAAEKEVPLIDLDGTVFLQFGIFVTLAVVLYFLVFGPYLGLRDRREDKTSGTRERARGAEAEAARLESERAARLASARQTAERERLRLREQAAAYEQEVLKAARGETERRLAEAREQLAGERARARAQLIEEAQPLAREIAGRLLGRSL